MFLNFHDLPDMDFVHLEFHDFPAFLGPVQTVLRDLISD